MGQTTQTRGNGASNFPLGPYHPALPEPVWYHLHLHSETIDQVEVTTGYCHRGVETLLAQRSVEHGLMLAERLCGSAGHHHRLGFCLALERLAGVQAPPLARALRSLFCEIERLLSHCSWATRMAQAADYPRAFYAAVEAREQLLEALEASTGQRLLWGLPIPGGVTSKPAVAPLEHALRHLTGKLEHLEREFIHNRAMRQRTQRLATISLDQARQLQLTGPVARASGLHEDARRQQPYDAYTDLALPAPESNAAGDTAARLACRVAEMRASLKLATHLLETLPNGPLAHSFPEIIPDGDAEASVETPQGQETWHLRSNGLAHLAAISITTPSQRNLAAVHPALEGQQLSDALLILASLDLCIACIDK